ncbi:MAG: YigZ family protein [Lachnospiraceae bacterium]|nr:YigZ family protein [Lachnospiraceae bacterium]
MLKQYSTVFSGADGEIVEKKSRFIAHIELAESEEEALAFVEKMKKKYWDARHNCYAFRIGTEHTLERCSDDGEPSGTAGKPMLEVLTGRNLYNVVAVVTRYFGGTLLGTGGLVRAYTKSMQEGLEASTLVEKKLASMVDISCDYSLFGKIQYLAATEGFSLCEIQYTDSVSATLLIPVDDTDYVKKKLIEISNGSIVMEDQEPAYFGEVEGEIIIFD